MKPRGETKTRARSREAAYRYGHVAEALAALLLMTKGYRLLARRYRTPLGEIDLIARRGRQIAFVEVKARPTRDEALESVGRFSERRIVEAADMWLSKHPDAAGLDLRYDMILLTPWRWPKHVADAFRPGWEKAV